MSDAVSQYGFTVGRRGYAPEQVDRSLVALTAQRDAAWERRVGQGPVYQNVIVNAVTERCFIGIVATR